MTTSRQQGNSTTQLSVVVIGRNEGERLRDCLASVNALPLPGYAIDLIYVDSASSDGSPELARRAGARVLDIGSRRPCAALARNIGWRAARGEFVLFLDGDTTLHPLFPQRALKAMAEPDVAVVWGHRRESDPGQSLYVRVLDLDWVYPPGDSEFCGGDALMRREDLDDCGGFDDQLIAGEEPELCQRLRARGRRILHIDAPMTAHDLAIRSFAGYWRRALRAGHAYAEIARRFRHSDIPLWRREARHNLAMATALLAGGALLLALGHSAPGMLPALAVVLSGVLWRSMARCRYKTDSPMTRLLYVLHSHFQQIPIACGQIIWHINRYRGRRQNLIEYKHCDGSL